MTSSPPSADKTSKRAQDALAEMLQNSGSSFADQQAIIQRNAVDVRRRPRKSKKEIRQILISTIESALSMIDSDFED